jgi:hypothetical protein
MRIRKKPKTPRSVSFYNNRNIHCYKYTGGSDESNAPSVDEEPFARNDLTVAQMHDLNRRLPPLDMSHEDVLSESSDVTWPEFVELFQTISDDADAMQDDLLPALDRKARSMDASTDKDAVTRLVASYSAKLQGFFEVLDDIEADIEMLQQMLVLGIVDVAQVEACIAEEPPPDDDEDETPASRVSNWDAYADLVDRLRARPLPPDQRARLIAETRGRHGALRPIGLIALLEGHRRSFAKWETKIDAWNSVLEETQHYTDRDARYRQACRDEHFCGTKEQYESGLRAQDASIYRQMDALRRSSVEHEASLTLLRRALDSHDPTSPEFARVQAQAAEIRSQLDENRSTHRRLHSSLSPVSLLEHVRLDDSRQLHDITSDYHAKLSGRDGDQTLLGSTSSTALRRHTGVVATHVTKRRDHGDRTTSAAVAAASAAATHTTPPKTVAAPRRPKAALPQRCECRMVKTKVECANKPGCKWRMGIGCCKAPNG